MIHNQVFNDLDQQLELSLLSLPSWSGIPIDCVLSIPSFSSPSSLIPTPLHVALFSPEPSSSYTVFPLHILSYANLPPIDYPMGNTTGEVQVLESLNISLGLTSQPIHSEMHQMKNFLDHLSQRDHYLCCLSAPPLDQFQPAHFQQSLKYILKIIILVC